MSINLIFILSKEANLNFTSTPKVDFPEASNLFSVFLTIIDVFPTFESSIINNLNILYYLILKNENSNKNEIVQSLMDPNRKSKSKISIKSHYSKLFSNLINKMNNQ
jgi:hypothetical protein